MSKIISFSLYKFEIEKRYVYREVILKDVLARWCSGDYWIRVLFVKT